MNSDLIRERFGSYFVDVMRQSEQTRLANLYSMENGEKICRTLALTQFFLPTCPELAEPDQQIRRGASIGATLRGAGYAVEKIESAIIVAKAGRKMADLTGGQVATGSRIEIRVYALNAVSAGSTYPYAMIAEAYHPAHIPPASAAINVDMALEKLSSLERQALNAIVTEL
ncbi:hypothetical protein NOR51B_544 [Luminiphilus syltensis NOR5-1B]|uniref:Uncharacterized protein n=1 Tax=Luminiphilus syltensis NOR5-1B TaxID=565045 RepID=B8KRI4_9GAMM|nr:hypothetical protein [Luminiphilus syltensis]EED34606.1 hypothetical protein NOR51B_544 [Luminiphilus syltensis NOR5-1B]